MGPHRKRQFGGDAMTSALIEQLKALLPPVSYDPAAPVLEAQLYAEAQALSVALTQLEDVEGAIFPATSGGYIVDWERIFALSPASGATQEQRIAAVEAAMGDLGGQSIPYFSRLASLFAVAAEIQTFRIPVVGLLNTGDPVYAGDWPFIWRVNSPLEASVTPPMEARITERRPANTEVVFGYGREVITTVLSAVDQLFGTVHYDLPIPMSNDNE